MKESDLGSVKGFIEAHGGTSCDVTNERCDCVLCGLRRIEDYIELLTKQNCYLNKSHDYACQASLALRLTVPERLFELPEKVKKMMDENAELSVKFGAMESELVRNQIKRDSLQNELDRVHDFAESCEGQNLREKILLREQLTTMTEKVTELRERLAQALVEARSEKSKV